MSLLLSKRFCATASAGRCSRLVVRAELPFDASNVVGDKLGRWMKTPFDLLAFGPRASTGALISAPERLQRFQTDMERVMELVQDPRPMEEKREVLLKEVEDTFLELLERGADIETDVWSNIKTVLPMEIANMLSEMIPEPPSKMPVAVDYADVSDEPTVTYSKGDVAASQISSGISEIRLAVSGLKGALEDIRTNVDPAKASMMRLNLREARDQLARRLNEVANDANADDNIASAMREAAILLDEVNAQFFSE